MWLRAMDKNTRFFFIILFIVALIIVAAVTFQRDDWKAYPQKIIVDTIEEFNWKNTP